MKNTSRPNRKSWDIDNGECKMAGVAPQVELVDLSRHRVAVISASWHKEICDALVAGAHRALSAANVKIEPVIYVPGSFELPLAAQLALDSGFDAAVVLGVVVRGETPHFDYVCKGVTDGVMRVTLDTSKPIGFGVLTVENIEQAISRSGVEGSKEDKGFDSAVAALELLRIATGFAGSQG
jgi:6,7-dimethyl-8-ribityllumazine synthase